MKIVKRSFAIVFKILTGIVAFLLVYILSALGLSRITVNSDQSKENKEVSIFIKTNGVHTDIVVPAKNEIKDWTKDILFQHTKSKDTIMKYLAFGWGDKGFYLDTPDWSDLKASVAFKAATGLSTSAMHTTFYKNILQNENCKEIRISKENYLKLVEYISNSFQKENNKNTSCISGQCYANNDAFYEARGSYSLFYTCNTWANNALKAANQKAALWTPYDGGIFCHYN
jgi:uncharacterized protein (TIGR02117 family)